MSSIQLTDSEVAVLIDSLAHMRDRIRAEGYDAPNVEGALDKIKSLMTPSTNGLTITAQTDKYIETAIVASVPETTTQVLVRLPGHLDPTTVQVDFRPDPGATWMPQDFFPNSVRVEHQ